MQREISFKNTEKQGTSSSASSGTSDLIRKRGKQTDLEQGTVNNGTERGYIENFSKYVKQQYEMAFLPKQVDTLAFTNKSHESDNVTTEQRVKEIVSWLRKDVLDITSDREERIYEKVRFCLEQRPVTAKLLENGVQLQKAGLRTCGNGYLMQQWEKVLPSNLSTVKEQVAKELSEDRARYDHLSRELETRGGGSGWLQFPIKREMGKLEVRIEKSNVLKDKVAKVRTKALELIKQCNTNLDSLVDSGEISAREKAVKLQKFSITIHHGATQKIEALKAAHRSDLQKEELKTEQHHTTHGVGIGNLLHVGEMIPGYASLALSALAEMQASHAAASAADAAKKH